MVVRDAAVDAERLRREQVERAHEQTFREVQARVDLGATDRLDAYTTYSTGQISTLRFDAKDSQIAKFHDAFLAALPMVIAYGPQWRQNEERLRRALGKLDLNDLHQFVTSRLQFLSQASGGFRGSMFILEAGAVLERMAPLFFQ